MPTDLDAGAILERLVGFDTVSAKSNLALIDWVADYLDGYGIASTPTRSPDGGKANLFATIGPRHRGGVILSGHTDVVPVEG
jgi:acetylornithine deacetylase